MAQEGVTLQASGALLGSVRSPPPPRFARSPSPGGARGGTPAGLDLRAALRALAERGITRVFCEGGPGLAEGLAEADLVDEVVLLTGGLDLAEPGLPAIGPNLSALLTGPRFTRVSSERAGPDTIDVYERQA